MKIEDLRKMKGFPLHYIKINFKSKIINKL